MRKALVGFLILAALLVGGVVAATTAVVGGGASGFDTTGDGGGSCTPVVAGPVDADTDLTPNQVSNVKIIIGQGKRLHVAPFGWAVAIAVAKQESGILNLASRNNPDSLNYPHQGVADGDADSVGIMQQRDAWGTMAQRMNVAKSVAMFYTGGHGGQHGLLDIDGWQEMDLTVAAQTVQVSKYPDAYASWETMAYALVKKYGDSTVTGCTPAPSGPTPKQFDQLGNPFTVDEAIQWENEMVSTHTPVTPFMCEHYVGIAFGWPNGGSMTALDHWNNIPTALKHPGLSTPPRGAIVFWATSATTSSGEPAGHIAVSMGGGMIASTDYPSGYIGITPIANIDAWGPRLGWAAPYFVNHSHLPR